MLGVLGRGTQPCSAWYEETGGRKGFLVTYECYTLFFCGGRMYFFAPGSGFGSYSLAFYDPFFIYFPNMNSPWFCWVSKDLFG